MGHKRFFLYLFLVCASHLRWCEASYQSILHKRFTLQPAKVTNPPSQNTQQVPTQTLTTNTTGLTTNQSTGAPSQTIGQYTNPTFPSTNINHNNTATLTGMPKATSGVVAGHFVLTPNNNSLPLNTTGLALNQTNNTGLKPSSISPTNLGIPVPPPISKPNNTVSSLATSLEIPPAPPFKPNSTALSSNTALSIPPPPPLPPTPDRSCQKVPLTAATWKELKIDEYLKSYPGGSKLNLADFAAQHGAYNFLCGLGESCHAGQLCAPIQGPAWYVLFAAQQYTVFQQSLYDAIGFVSTQISAIGAQLVQEMFPPIHKKKAFSDFRIGMILTMAAAVASSLACAVFLFVPGFQPFALAAATAAALAISSTTALLKSQAEDKKAAKEDSFTRWAHYSSEISGWQTDTQNSLGQKVQNHISAGISTEEGIYGAIKNGQFGYNTGIKTTTDLEDGYREVLMARMFSELLRSKEAFVTIGSDACNQGGPNGAFKVEDGWLSFCDSNGLMMNIISAHNDEADNIWPHADSLTTKYGMTVEYLTKQSIDCQNKYREKYGFGYDPYASGALPNDKNSDCLVNLLVCDCTLPGMHHARKKTNTVVACRHRAGVPV
ncbi:hypothetical protein CROQUDRAFT_724560 [Cronartium quercuum f. sp. fusiforme G11]|uniref:DUF7872 domain-containing protein n=1 Tax=Cronartium quercuum f. sp. fusiforme G11 TaxID=708437 RepID=A0A9P6T8T0_9BASI|nr:hypothetical protein CROQUDRAFT_724560 [Cronartium quercuum f. sp. fusiforme G11]